MLITVLRSLTDLFAKKNWESEVQILNSFFKVFSIFHQNFQTVKNIFHSKLWSMVKISIVSSNMNFRPKISIFPARLKNWRTFSSVAICSVGHVFISGLKRGHISKNVQFAKRELEEIKWYQFMAAV